MRQNSLLYWYPLIKDLDIPQPKTIIFKLTEGEIFELTQWVYGECVKGLSGERWKELKKLINPLGYPVFMRTDETSCKHGWEKTCFVKSEKVLKQHVLWLLEDNECCGMMGLPYKASVFREYIQMNTLFHAFHGNMPINPEYRFFVGDGKVECFHWYWVEEAIEQGSRNLPKNWKDILNSCRTCKDEVHNRDLVLLKHYAEEVSKVVPGRWSVDFCQAKDGTWFLIDLALWENSWHPTDCPNCPEDQKSIQRKVEAESIVMVKK